ncbi:hypothetical protein AVV02_gp286 [Bacillus phage AvesoBmore]|uniref:Uncharacterized protein n=6 Tax=Caudoviricetes TaxID=2731619 RepID=A0A0K2D0Z8_9CAUD|nr:hypothetical protein AVV02_gp286 [Bacillus phage AvesoBmore]ALA13425.1 hypothetical protein AVESOBMORE_286 [Bacillus phage AvesoBmore]
MLIQEPLINKRELLYMERLTFEQWKDVFRNVKEINNDLKHEGFEEEPLEVVWLESTNEYVIASGCEVIEDEFKTEHEAQTRLDNMEHEYNTYIQEEERKYKSFLENNK